MSSPTAATSRSRGSHGRRRSQAPRFCTRSSPSSASRLPALRCSPAWCCATCATPRPPSPPARTGCAISRCTTRCAACRTAISSASGWRQVIAEVKRGGAAGGGVLHRPRPFQGRQRHARPSDRRRTHPQRHAAAVAHHARRRSGGAARRRRVRRHHHRVGRPCRAAARSPSRIIATLCAPYSISGHTIVIGASIGIAVIDQRSGGCAPTSCATPTWRSTGPRTKAATAPASTTR